MMEKKFFIRKNPGAVKDSSGNPAINFFVKSPRSYCSQSSKNKEIDKYSKSHFLKLDYLDILNSDGTTLAKSFWRKNSHLLSHEIRECEAQIPNRNFSRKLPLGR